ncbi:MAG TPA: hypothetical protein VFV93_10580 [Thermomicrobiales bacterium]|nr:hypothetical protein [Thermomicrobiales bacterium]
MVALQAQPVVALDDRESMKAEMKRLLFRLEDGYEKIAQAAVNGDDVRRWEDVWLQLLCEYEELYDRMAA